MLFDEDMRPLALLNPGRWSTWIGELRGFLEARQNRFGYISTRSESGVVYSPLPKQVWPTKSFEFWSFLMGLLQRVHPESILELGSGRSTVYLSEYASKNGKLFVSIEQSQTWTVLNNALSRFGNIKEQFVQHLPIEEDGFYDKEQLDAVLPASPDFIFLDGPNGTRDTTRQLDLYRQLAGSARVVVLDDIHLPTIYPQVELFRTTGLNRDAVYFRYPVKSHFDNYLSVLFDQDLRPTVDDLIQCLGVEAFDTVTENICVDKKTGVPAPPSVPAAG